MDKIFIIDIQGFTIEKNKFIPKELAAYNGTEQCHFIFKQPWPKKMLIPTYQKQVEWLENNHHSIDWKEGFTPLHKFHNIMFNLSGKADVFYVKGREKSKYLQKFTDKPVKELNEQPALNKMVSECIYHKHKICYCSLTIVHYLYNNFYNPN